MAKGIRLARLLAAATLAAGAAPAAADEWRFIGRSEGRAVYLDTDSVNRSGDVVAFWTLSAREPVTAGSDVTEVLGSGHCSDLTYRAHERRENPTTTLRQPTWVVAVRGGWKQFDADDRTRPGDPLREIIRIACGDAPSEAPSDPASEPERIAAVPVAVPPAANTGPVAAPVAIAPPPPPAPPPDVPALPAWVDLGASLLGQAIAIEATDIQDEDTTPTAWFRLTEPGEVAPAPVSYRLRIDCAERTINQLGLRKYDEDGDVVEQRDYGPDGEGEMPVEPETVMEIAYRGLCTGDGAAGIRRIAGLPEEKETAEAAVTPAAEPPPSVP